MATRSRQAVFIDAAIPDLQGFVAGLPAHLDRVLLNSQALQQVIPARGA